RHLIGEGELRLLKRSAILINVSRGAIVDEQALLEALTEGRIAGAGLDTFSYEPLALDGHLLSPLFEMENVVLT
ncbi:MAG: C-terminal binding protein, partial [Burkholderiales bacterium]|nr:C-terminal binding protein [Burkholderiales bacterium]